MDFQLFISLRQLEATGDWMGPAHQAATSESGARAAGPLLSGNFGPGEG